MSKFTTTGRLFYAAALAGVAVQQLYYQDFCPMLFPAWPHPVTGYALLACLFSLFLIAGMVLIAIPVYARTAALLTGGVLLLMLLFGQVTYEFLIVPYKKTHLGIWILPLKELALTGGAFCITGSCTEDRISQFFLIRLLKKLIPFGPLFFSATMIAFGVSHFLYPDTVANMVPAWIPAHYFWTYLTGVALILAGIGIVSNVQRELAAILLGAMVLFWFLFLHVPGAFRYPLLDKGNLVFSAFSALAFSGIAWVIAGTSATKQSSKRARFQKSIQLTANEKNL